MVCISPVLNCLGGFFFYPLLYHISTLMVKMEINKK